jgi:hypothetical protein
MPLFGMTVTLSHDRCPRMTDLRHVVDDNRGAEAHPGKRVHAMSESRLDRGTKIYIGVLAAIVLAVLIAWLLSLDPRVWKLNDRLEQDPEIAAYPFPFRVLEIRNGVAVVASPRSPQVSVIRFLGVIDPGLRNADPDSPAAVTAQKKLASVQGRVRKLVEAEPDIQRVSWRLDADWLAGHGVQVER